MRADFLIIGGGVIGLSTAWRLARRGATVAIVDQAAVGKAASWAGAGILPDASLSHARTPMQLLHAHSVRLWPEWSSTLREETGIDNGFRVCGGIEIGGPTEEWHGEGTALEHRPEGVFYPGMAQVRNPRHLRALVMACRNRGVRIEEGWPVRRLIPHGAEGERGRIEAGALLLANGAWAGQMGIELPIRPVRGQMALFDNERPTSSVIILDGKRYLVPRGDGKVLAGSTEEEAGFDATTTEEGVDGLVRFARATLPWLAEARLEQAWAGLRPASADGLPFMGQVREGAYIAAGHFRAGLGLSPATGEAMARLLTGEEPLLPLEAFTPHRCGSGSR